MYVPITGWVPDADDAQPGLLMDVNDMIPTIRGYAGAPSGISVGLAALAAECRGAMAVTLLDDTNVLFAGTQTKLYKAGTATWTDVTRTGSDYTGSTTSRWCFTQQGNVTLACNKVDESQYYVHGSSTDFANMAEMPKALVAEAVNNFVLIGNYHDSTDTVDGWACSALGDYADWTASTTTQCTYGRLYDTPGPIVALKRLMDYAVYFKRRSMYLARYVGQPNAWEFSLVSDVIGAVSNDAVVRVGTTLYFLGDDTFYAYDSASVQVIGEQIREWFNADCNNAKRTSTVGLHDQSKGIVYWYYARGTSTTLNAWVAYNYRSQKWSKGERSIESAVQYVSVSASYDDLDTRYSTYDGFPSVSYDELSPSGYTKLPAVFNTSHAIQTLTGTSTSSNLTSGDIGEDGSISLLSRVRARYMQGPTTAVLTNYYRDALGDSLTEDSTVFEVSRKFDVFRSSRWHRIKAAFTGDLEIVGADITMQPDGEE